MATYITLLCTIISILACFLASYTDIKSGIIPNKLTFSLIGLGIVLNGFNAFLIGNIWLIVYALIITAIIFALGYVLWKFGAWAGGDVKLFTALAALLPFYPAIVNYNILGVPFPVIGVYPFPLTLIINSILAIFPFILIFIFYIAFKKKPYLREELIAPIKEYRKNIVLALVITSAVALTIIITPYLPFQMILITLILFYLLTLIISKLPNRMKAIIVSILVAFALYNNVLLTSSTIVVLFVTLTIVGVIRKVLTSVNKKALQDDVNIEDLKEGMISAYNIYDNGEIYVDNKGFLDKIKESIKRENNTSFSGHNGKLLISNMAAGLSKKDIEVLKKLYNEDKVSNEFKIKKGVPFAPSIFIGLLISIFIGDLALILQKLLYFLFT